MTFVRIILVVLFFVSNFAVCKNTANFVENNYENAATAFTENKVNDAFIFVKNALQKNPEHLPSKILISKIFFDAGNIWGIDYDSSLSDNSKIRSSVGIAVDFFTPIGPLNFSLTEPITKGNNDITESFRFNIGTTF